MRQAKDGQEKVVRDLKSTADGGGNSKECNNMDSKTSHHSIDSE